MRDYRVYDSRNLDLGLNPGLEEQYSGAEVAGDCMLL
jgi:hypothetical protein